MQEQTSMSIICHGRRRQVLADDEVGCNSIAGPTTKNHPRYKTYYPKNEATKIEIISKSRAQVEYVLDVGSDQHRLAES